VSVALRNEAPQVGDEDEVFSEEAEERCADGDGVCHSAAALDRLEMVLVDERLAVHVEELLAR
jgi:hypothetical protein